MKKQYQYTTQKQVRNQFWQSIKETSPELAKEYKANKRQNQYSATLRSIWVDYVDQLERSGEISSALSNRITL